MAIPVAKRSQARACGLSLAGIAGSNPAGGMDVCVLCCKQRKKEKCRTIKTKETSRMKFEQSTGEYKKKILPGACLCLLWVLRVAK